MYNSILNRRRPPLRGRHAFIDDPDFSNPFADARSKAIWVFVGTKNGHRPETGRTRRSLVRQGGDEAGLLSGVSLPWPPSGVWCPVKIGADAIGFDDIFSPKPNDLADHCA
ncbi:hypothetical protein GJ654_20405 [Rhodoblastus acidophilus]|uniref:Uncharacterized protein n=1 Tax=Rhodoblastus acidophilus TaxID=1074 RepID=A0A6N8DRU6_RHOAC|nr:hypothetical protein [Rhodoblastus acidophilus]MCW2276519.1 hypothetical protein [Rhodoblastus acidophilus]MTV33342.1 hypothetical protein [Rhodoblastus acidophilus]